MSNILIITVNYKNTIITEDFIHSLENLDAIDRIELIVVDSESTLKTKENLQSLLNSSGLKTRLIDSVSNTFYWGGVALALKAVLQIFDRPVTQNSHSPQIGTKLITTWSPG